METHAEVEIEAEVLSITGHLRINTDENECWVAHQLYEDQRHEADETEDTASVEDALALLHVLPPVGDGDKH